MTRCVPPLRSRPRLIGSGSALVGMIATVNPTRIATISAIFHHILLFRLLPLLGLRCDDEKVKDDGQATEQNDVEHHRLAVAVGLKQSNREHFFSSFWPSPARSDRTAFVRPTACRPREEGCAEGPE